jgi:hypothetical protein
MISSSGSMLEKSDFIVTTNHSRRVPRKTFYKIEEKLKILDKIKQGAKKSLLIQKFKINFSTLSNWIKNEKKLREASQHSKFTVHKGPKLRLCPDEKHILAFIHKKNQNQEVIYTRDVIKEAIKISPLMKNLGSKALFAWVYRFFKRNLINFSNGSEDAEKTANAKSADLNSSNVFANADENGSGKGKSNLFSAVTAFTETCSAEISEACSSSSSSQISGFEKFPDRLEAESAVATLTLRKSKKLSTQFLHHAHSNSKNTDQIVFNELSIRNTNNNFIIKKTNYVKNSPKPRKNNQKPCYFSIRKETKKAREAQKQQLERIQQEELKSYLLTDFSLISNSNSALCELNINSNNNKNNLAYEKDESGIEDKTDSLVKYQDNCLAAFGDLDFYCESLNNHLNYVAFEGIL